MIISIVNTTYQKLMVQVKVLSNLGVSFFNFSHMLINGFT